jgi:hypothetical protein
MEIFEGVVHDTNRDIFTGGSLRHFYLQLGKVSKMLHALSNTESMSQVSGRGRIGKLYIAAEEWNGTKCVSEAQDIVAGEDKLLKCRYEVHRGEEDNDAAETAMVQLGSVSDRATDQYLFRHSDAGAFERHIWWLSDGSRGLALMKPSDMVDSFTGHKLARMGCCHWGWFEGGRRG